MPCTDTVYLLLFGVFCAIKKLIVTNGMATGCKLLISIERLEITAR